MKPHPRIRKTIKWGGAAVTVLLVVVWIGSGWWSVGWTSGRYGSVSVGGGQVIAMWCDTSSLKSDIGWRFRERASAPYVSRFRYCLSFGSAPGLWFAQIPLWCVAPIPLCATAAAWRLDTLARRRARLNLCPKCNYDRTGLAVGAVCPECGKASVMS